MIEELNGANSNALLRKYVWQQNSQWFDVPLAVTEGTTTRFYTTDANKNVSEVLNANGTVASHYEYSPFGQQTAATGTYTANLFRFSSEVFDPETTLVYYNYRYYNPALGRWMSRDPIIWTGNLYAFIGNIPIIKFDILGLFSDGRESIREKLRQVCVPYEEYVSGTVMGIPIVGGCRGCRPYTPEEIEELIDDEYLGHSDFPGSDQFDYTAEDHDPATNPYDRPERHFQDPIDALNDVRSVIFSCNKHRFERAMHRLQDNWTHYAKGYRSTWFHGWHPVHWPIGHIGGGTYPDKDNEAWQRAANATQRMLNSWNRNCCKDKNGKWERKSSGCCDK